jgi:hypothetical protein
MKTERESLCNIFLSKSFWKDAKKRNIASDASKRRYFRLTLKNEDTAIFMDAAPQLGEDVNKFLKSRDYLEKIGLSVPKVYDKDIENGFLILEDFGNNLFSKFLLNSPQYESNFYINAADNLVKLYNSEIRIDIETYDRCAMRNAALLSVDWYLEYGTKAVKSTKLRDSLNLLMDDALNKIMNESMVMIHRDFHAENLIWLKGETGLKRVGILDFQDMMLGHPAYDLASLLNDIRRTVKSEVQRECLNYYIDETGLNKDSFFRAFCICSAQRNLRVLGVFTRLSVRDKKKNYLNFLPTIWKNLLRDLEHPALRDLKLFVESSFIAPDQTIIKRIKNSYAP